MIQFDVSGILHPAVFVTRFPTDLGSFGEDRPWGDLERACAAAPVERSEELRGAVRALLRAGGHKPSGRGKPSSEYLVRAVEKGGLPVINLAVDACNLVSFQSGLPMSVVDLDKAEAPFTVCLGEPDTSYVFNLSDQTIRLDGLLCLLDAQGPCANAVKDSQRTKTSEATLATCSILWGPASHAEHVESTVAWYRELLESAGATTERLQPQ
ncbi:MAG: DNA/RNA-binding domain of Phe-tRNA-synthetase-like protein [Planctomycetota bacterium]|jgi:DNA/RNA-binding domain of Phe-tRNA-synthetase-like protein